MNTQYTTNLFPTAELNDDLNEWLELDCQEEYPNFNYESFMCRVEEIETNHVSGFIPFTNGGLVISWITDMSTAVGSGSYPAILQHEVNRLESRCMEDYKDEYPEHFYEDELEEDYQEHYGDYWLEYFSEGTVFSYELRLIKYNPDNSRNLTGETEWFIVSGINTDYEYMRDSGLITVYKATIKEADLIENPDLLTDCIIDAISFNKKGV